MKTIAHRRWPSRRRATGASMVEFIIVLPILLLLCLGILQFGLLYQAKSTLDYAALQAARAGALNNGKSAAMRTGLARGLAPLYARTASLAGQQQADHVLQSFLKLPDQRPHPACLALDDLVRAGDQVKLGIGHRLYPLSFGRDLEQERHCTTAFCRRQGGAEAKSRRRVPRGVISTNRRAMWGA